MKCNDICTPQLSIYDSACPLHGAKALKTKLQRRKETQGKRTSEGYEPKPGEKVEVRGD
jgi:hypothetical protein